MKILVGCEQSGVVRSAFAALGHDAWSCDLLPSEIPGNHIQDDILNHLDDGWDLMIAHPDCTYLTGSAEWAYGDGPYHQKVKPETLVGAKRRQARVEAIDFFLKLANAPIPKRAIENPVGCISTVYRKPDQTIQPHWFGDDASKATCLWLFNLPKLVPTCMVPPRIVGGKKRWGNQTDGGQNKLPPSKDRWKLRSRTYQGVADAMVAQWGMLEK